MTPITTPDHDEDDNPITPDTHLLRHPQRPSLDFDGLHLGGDPLFSWKDRLSLQMPSRVKDIWFNIAAWTQGPDPPRIFKITPFLPTVQHFPLTLLDRYAPKRSHRVCLLLLLYASWLLSFSLILRASSASASIPGYGTPANLGCTSRYWSEGNDCGLNGDRCRPFANATLAFRCPADCHKVQTLNPHAVGDQEIVYQSLIVGGPSEQPTGFEDDIVENAVYRGDSFICAAAIHSGFLPAALGGCGVLTLTGTQSSFTSSYRHGLTSTPFPSYFPHSFGFLAGTRAQCADLRWPALGISVFFTTLLSLFTTSPAIFFTSTFIMLFFHVALASDPPNIPDIPSLLSLAISRFLPACFCAYVVYCFVVRRSLTNLTAQLEKSVLWLGPAWVGALNNYTFDKIPIQRLTPHDIAAQPGAIPALLGVLTALLLIAVGQAWTLRQEGRMPRYLAVYGILVSSLGVLAALPGLSLRIHHYILALLLLPGTAVQTRPSLVWQGLLVGLFINGVARWGFASLVETPGSLLSGVNAGTALPEVTAFVSAGLGTVKFELQGGLPVREERDGTVWEGLSVLVNDVERFRGYMGESGGWGDDVLGGEAGGNFSWVWKRHGLGVNHDESLGDGKEDVSRGDGVHLDGNVVLPEYFRFAYLSGSDTADYTKAGKWDVDGKWIEMEPGPS